MDNLIVSLNLTFIDLERPNCRSPIFQAGVKFGVYGY